MHCSYRSNPLIVQQINHIGKGFPGDSCLWNRSIIRLKEHKSCLPHINVVNYYQTLRSLQMKRKSGNNPILHTCCLMKQPEVPARIHLCLVNNFLFPSILKPSIPRGDICLLPAGNLWLIPNDYMEHLIMKLTVFINYFWRGKKEF